jgi:low temperature requirement protein LtrA
MNPLGAAKNYLRPRTAQGTAPVAQVEVFFDLVFAFAVTQLSTTLRTDLTSLGLVHTLMLFAAVWWVWVYTAWVTNWLNPRNRPVQLMLIVLSFLGLLLSASLPGAFTTRGIVFAGAYVAMQLGRTGFMLWAVRRHHPGHFRNMRRIGTWLCASGLFWLAGGLVAEPLRDTLWLFALVLDIASPALGFYVPGLGRSTTAEWDIDSYHLAERCAGFILIALGESVTVTGAAFFSLHWTLLNTTAFLAAFVGSVAVWWIYFDAAAERTADAFAHAADPGRIARAAYTYLHGLLVAGIIADAAGDALLLQDPTAPVTAATGLIILGGPALYLLGNGLFRRHLAPLFPPSHVYGILLLAVLALAAPYLQVLALAGAVALVLVFVTVLGDILFRRRQTHSYVR